MNISFALRLLARDWRSGELSILAISIALAVSIVVGISTFVSSFQNALLSESGRFLAADMVVSSRSQPPEIWLVKAEQLGLGVASQIGFPSMAVTDDDMVLVSIKAVSDGYPLKGSLKWSKTAYGEVEEFSKIPEVGEVFLAPRLFGLLNLDNGDEVMVGQSTFKVSGAVRSEPDATTAIFGLGPRLMMNKADIPRTGVVQPGSRVQHRFLLSGNFKALDQYKEWIEPRLDDTQSLQTIQGSQPKIGATFDKAQGFLLLAGSLAVVLAAAAIMLAARRFAERHAKYVAIFKSLGARSHQITKIYFLSLLFLGLIATLIGCLLGWLIQEAFLLTLRTLLPFEPGSVGWDSLAIGAITALVCLGFCAWPPISRLSVASPLRVLRAEIGIVETQRTTDLLMGALAMFILIVWYSGDLFITSSLFFGLIMVAGVGFCFAKMLLSGGHHAGGFAGGAWRLAMGGLQRRSAASALQMVIFAISIMLLLLLFIVRTSLIDQWRSEVPEGTPNHFLLNLAPEERKDLELFFSESSVEAESFFPMTRGRVTSVNGASLPVRDIEGSASEPRQRGANFTWSDTLPKSNDVVEGGWWPPDTDQALVSLEASFARDIGAALGDELTLRIGPEILSVRVSNIREVDWQSMRPNFYAIFPRGVLESYPSMYLTSFFLAPDQKEILNRLMRQFSTVTIIEIDVVINEMIQIIDQVSLAVELVLMIVLFSVGLVLVAGVKSSLSSRLEESALLRAIGARKPLILGSLWIEFASLGGLAGLLASIGAEASAWTLQTKFFEFSYQATPLIWFLGPTIGALIVGGLGVWACRRIATTPPTALLREVQS